MDAELNKILCEVERYLAKTKMAPTAFGLNVANDRTLARRIRAGKPITSKSMSLIRAYMKDNPPPKRAARSKKQA